MISAIKLNWTQFKNTYLLRGFRVQEVIRSGAYHLHSADNGIEFYCSIPITNPAGVDQAEYEATYRGVMGVWVHKEIHVENLSVVTAPGTTLYSVTAVKTLFVKSMSIVAVNTANAIGRFFIQDGLNNAKVIPVVVPQQPLGATAGQIVLPLSFGDYYRRFNTSVRVIGISGTIQASISITGYEQ